MWPAILTIHFIGVHPSYLRLSLPVLPELTVKIYLFFSGRSRCALVVSLVPLEDVASLGSGQLFYYSLP